MPNVDVSSRTPDGDQNRCPTCGHEFSIEPSRPPGDAPCPACGSLCWYRTHLLTEKLAEIPCNRRLPNLSPGSKKQSIVAIVNELVKGGLVPETLAGTAVRCLLAREELGSTAIGGGLATPHAVVPELGRLVTAIAFFEAGIDFAGSDSEPVYAVVICLGPDCEKSKMSQFIARAAAYIDGS